MTWFRRLVGAVPADEMDGIQLDEAAWVLSDVPDDVSRFEHMVRVHPRPALGTVWPRSNYGSSLSDPFFLSPILEEARVAAFTSAVGGRYERDDGTVRRWG